MALQVNGKIQRNVFHFLPPPGPLDPGLAAFNTAFNNWWHGSIPDYAIECPNRYVGHNVSLLYKIGQWLPLGPLVGAFKTLLPFSMFTGQATTPAIAGNSTLSLRKVTNGPIWPCTGRLYLIGLAQECIDGNNAGRIEASHVAGILTAYNNLVTKTDPGTVLGALYEPVVWCRNSQVPGEYEPPYIAPIQRFTMPSRYLSSQRLRLIGERKHVPPAPSL